MAGKTLYDKLWDTHGTDRFRRHGAALHRSPSGARGHLAAGVQGLQLAGRRPWRLESMVAMPDHNTRPIPDSPPSPTRCPACRSKPWTSTPESMACATFPIGDVRRGIVHVVGPEQGATLPGMTVVCGDSHTSTHGAFGALAFGIGTSEVEHVMATQCLIQKNPERCWCGGRRTRPGVTAKDIVLAIIGGSAPPAAPVTPSNSAATPSGR